MVHAQEPKCRNGAFRGEHPEHVVENLPQPRKAQGFGETVRPVIGEPVAPDLVGNESTELTFSGAAPIRSEGVDDIAVQQGRESLNNLSMAVKRRAPSLVINADWRLADWLQSIGSYEFAKSMGSRQVSSSASTDLDVVGARAVRPLALYIALRPERLRS